MIEEAVRRSKDEILKVKDQVAELHKQITMLDKNPVIIDAPASDPIVGEASFKSMQDRTKKVFTAMRELLNNHEKDYKNRSSELEKKQ